MPGIFLPNRWATVSSTTKAFFAGRFKGLDGLGSGLTMKVSSILIWGRFHSVYSTGNEKLES
jgi:hypothetical protein